jgi:MoxR-like ATPase
MENQDSSKLIHQWSQKVLAEVEKVILGKQSAILTLLAALLSGGHVLLEDLPGTGKTMLARALAQALGGSFARIQGTPDLLPADVLGVSVYRPQTGEFEYRPGPILNTLVLVDEINRATPRTQSALLEAMGEGQISVDGTTRKLPRPFFLIATENPVDFEGTFPLPEAQKDRFLLSLSLGYPGREIEQEIVLRQRRSTHPVEDLQPVTSPEETSNMIELVHQVPMDQTVMDYLMDLVEATRIHPSVRIGISPRGTLALARASQALAAIQGQTFVTPDTIKALVPAVFSQRIIIKPESQIRGTKVEQVVAEILDRTQVPMGGYQPS